MKSLTFLLISVLLLLETGEVKSQNLTSQDNLTKLEKKYNGLQISFLNEKLLLDSLHEVFNKRLREINNEKEKKSPDNEKITSLMANSVNLSNNIDEQQKKIESIGKAITTIKMNLNLRYTGIIDSLKNIQVKEKENKEKIDNLILFYATKRLEVTPEIYRLSFNPYKILELDLNKSKDSAYNKIYSEYINGAIREVDNILANISEESDEINQVVELQRKASRFVEETEMESGITSGKLAQTEEKSPASASLESGTEPDISFTGDRAKNANLNSNIKVYEELLNQLNTIKSLSVRQAPDESIQTLYKEIDLNSYGELLKEVIKRLNEYKKLLMQKSSSLK